MVETDEVAADETGVTGGVGVGAVDVAVIGSAFNDVAGLVQKADYTADVGLLVGYEKVSVVDAVIKSSIIPGVTEHTKALVWSA